MKKTFMFLFLVLVLVSCNSDKKGYVLEGKISNAKGEYAYLSVLGADQIVVLDSARLSGNGNFRFNVPISRYPDFYFLKIGKSHSITLLSDSSKKISIKADYPDVLATAIVEGNPESESLLLIDRKLNDLRLHFKRYKSNWEKKTLPEERKVLVDEMVFMINDYKKDVGEMIMSNPRSFLGYYILYQRIDDENLIFSPFDKNDFRYYGALATSLNIFYPNAPRTKALYEKVQEAIVLQRKERLEQMISEADEKLPDIGMPDIKGDTVMLSSKIGKVLILNYWFSGDNTSRLMNRELSKLYSKYKNRGLDIFQCSLDRSKVLWEVAVEEDNINWTTLCDFQGAASRAVWMYNVTQVPTNYLLDRKGNMVGKFTAIEDLENKIRELL